MALRDYIAAAIDTERDVLKNPPHAFTLADEIDSVFVRVLNAVSDKHPMPRLLCMQTHLLFKAAMRVAISGHYAAMFPIARSCLEAACYAYRMIQDESLCDIWANRHLGETELATCRKKFGNAVKDAAKDVEKRAPTVGGWIEDLYQGSIDFGAHPNRHSVFRSVSIDESGDYVSINLAAVYEADSFMVKWAMLAAVETGLGALCVVTLALRGAEDKDIWEAIQTLNDSKNELAADA
ncbi:hypothetical protein [Cupriavidus pinatubonensis]|uniref:HEPN AbiU2-like domain-containing protein n=1 Tax=Cupriavidus pinatubonensis TaxID=248026 RepID=A0ABM8WLT4_9BURK|nr:hypothetical protein [Cupriavidus pinatubonensis]CAG9168170.1 hypothetical protein LMG23994_01328 [Cupriavidus pinatubonensis]